MNDIKKAVPHNIDYQRPRWRRSFSSPEPPGGLSAENLFVHLFFYFWQRRLRAICRFQINSEFTAKFFISAAELKALFHGGHFVILRCAKLEKHLKFIPERKCEYQLANEAIYTCAKDVSCFTYNNQTNKRHINFIYKLNLR